MERRQIPHNPRHLRVPLCASKTISEPMEHLMQTIHLSCADTNTISKQKKQDCTWPVSPRRSIRCVQNDFWCYGMSTANHAPILHWPQHSLQTERSNIWHDPCHQGVPSGVSKMIYEPMVRSTQAVHLSCVKISTMSESTETSFHLSLVT
jgi:hypothetical protein